MLCTVGRGQLGEVPRGRARGGPLGIQRASEAARKAAVARVLELLHPERERDITGAGGNRINRAPEGFRARGAEVLDPSHCDVRQAERRGEGKATLANIDFFVVGGEPGGVQLATVDARIKERFFIGLHHELLGAALPALAEA